VTNQPDNPPPDPTAGAPISGQPWPTPSGDALSEQPQAYQPPPAYAPGHAPIPEPDNPPTSQFPAQPPPVNYAPPGYAPDYGAPDYGAPDYGTYPPQPGYPPPAYAPPGYGPPAPRKSNAPIIAVILAVALLLCGGIATAGVLIARSVADKAKETAAPFDNLPTAVPTLPGVPTDLPTDGAGRTISVTYEVSGDGPVSIVYLDKIGDAPVRLSDVKLPWKFTTQVQTPALLSVVVVRLNATDGTVKCRALIDGDEVKTNASGKSAFATTSCTHLALA